MEALVQQKKCKGMINNNVYIKDIMAVCNMFI